MTRLKWLQIILGLVIVAALAGWLASNFELVDEKVNGRYRGEALRDPHYAARLLIAKLGYPTQTISDPSQLALQPTSATIVSMTVMAESIEGRIEPGLVDWVKRGGHLVMAVPSPDQSSRFTKALGLTRLGIYRASRTEPQALLMEGRLLKVDMRVCDVFTVGVPLIWGVSVGKYRPYPTAEDDEPKERIATALAAARWQFGAGTVTALCSEQPLSNSAIGKNQNAELVARAVLDNREPGGPIIFVPQPDYPNLLEWLSEHAWTVLLSAALLLFLILWAAMPRLGPIALEPRHARPGLREHLQAMAAFHLRKRHYLTLLQASREQLLRLAERHAGGVEVPLADIAAFAGISVQELQHALNFQPEDRASYLRLSAVLARVSDVLQTTRSVSSFNFSPKKS